MLPAVHFQHLTIIPIFSCRVWVNRKRAVKTQIKVRTKHPVWDEDLKLLVHSPELQSLTVELRDWDLMNPSDCIGRRAQFPIRPKPQP